MLFKDITDSPCGMRHMLLTLPLQSGYARRCLLSSSMMTTREEIMRAHDVLRHYVAFVENTPRHRIDTLAFKLKNLKDISLTISHLQQSGTLDDIELFEVKFLAILSQDVSRILHNHNLDKVIEIPELDEVVKILDPDGLRMATFYVYDSYDPRLIPLRAAMRRNPGNAQELLLQSQAIEDEVRTRLSEQLRQFATALAQAQNAIAQIDINLAKAMQIKEQNLILPTVASDTLTSFKAMFHPQVLQALSEQNKEFQPVDITFGANPTLITGANMGGKTVVLKTLALCQYLFQFGFGVPAQQATIALKEDIYFCIGDEQSIEKGLSSFAAEMRKIDEVITASRTGRQILALIDEPARTTNPTEGTALVSALLKVLNRANVSLVMTTHYEINHSNAHCLRVKGLTETMKMDYSLVEVSDGEVPHEALTIARSIGIDDTWLNLARQELEQTTNNE